MLATATTVGGIGWGRPSSRDWLTQHTGSLLVAILPVLVIELWIVPDREVERNVRAINDAEGTLNGERELHAKALADKEAEILRRFCEVFRNRSEQPSERPFDQHPRTC